MPVLVDTSVLVRLRDPASLRFSECAAALSEPMATAHDLCICAQVMSEYWVVVTRPVGGNGYGLAPEEARADLVRLRGFLRCLPEPADLADRWLRLVSDYEVRGKPAHDTRLVALMEAHGIRRLLTLNPADFARYADIECIEPGEIRTASP